jgi:hypothetical protein
MCGEACFERLTLPQLEERGVGVFGEVPLREHAQA